MDSSVNNITPRTSSSRFQDSVSLSSLDQRPRMLKEFLRSDDNHCHSSSSSSSSSSTGFQLYLGKKPWKSTPLITSKSNINPPMVLLRSQSKSAATFTISAIHKVINLVKVFPFASVKSPLVLPRGISRKLSRRSRGRNEILHDLSEVKVKVKDILRWTSFRDLAEEKSTPSDFASVQIMESTSISSLLGQTDFTKEDLPLWGGGSIDRCLLGQHATNDRLRNIPKVEWSFEECDEQQSPISVLDDSPFLEDEESISPHYLEFTGQRKCMLTPRTQEFEVHSFRGGEGEEEDKEVNVMSIAAEEKAKKLVVKVKETSHICGNYASHDDNLMLDFFKHELSINGKLDDVEFDSEILRVAKCWVDGDYEESFEWEVEDRREAYVKDMERGVGWNKFRDEQDAMSKELEVEVLGKVINEILIDFFVK